jgi:16S rRNA (guanine(966)-N(2))-methyltransferase RsmD
MRVVSGSCKGMGLKAVPGSSTRPTTDKVKEAIFNMVGPYFNGGIGLDLFAGSGSLGIEALSRGLEKVIFVDRDAKAIQIIQENIHNCKIVDAVEVYRNDALRAMKAIIKREITFDYIQQQLIKLLHMINENQLLNSSGAIVCEHSSDIELPERVGRFIRSKNEQYGVISITIYVIEE